MKKKHSERAHALLSASGASRWLNCTPSPVLEEQFDKETSTYAEEGTLAHELAELILRHKTGRISDKEYKAQLPAIKHNKLYSLEMPRHVEVYVDYVLEQYNIAKQETEGAVLYIEEKIDLTFYVPEGFGTVDNEIIADGTLEVIDLKYGKGLKVDADDNPQLKLYALGAVHAHELSYDIETVRLTIVQPRLNHISSWEISVEALKVWGEKVVRPKALLAFAGKGEQCAGDWCKWCAVKPKCKALADFNLDLAKLDFAEPMMLTDLEILEVYSKAKLFQDWLKAVDKHVQKEATKGKKWTGYKLVHGRSNRKWLDEDLVYDALLAEGFTEDSIRNVKIKGIGDIESLLSVDRFKEVLGKLVIKPPGKPTLVPETDKRQEYGISSAKKDFED